MARVDARFARGQARRGILDGAPSRIKAAARHVMRLASARRVVVLAGMLATQYRANQ